MTPPAGHEWHLITTAPKDGTSIVVWSPDIDDGEAGEINTYWDIGEHCWEWENRMFFSPNCDPTHWRREP